ncbi:MAG: Lrp/AsnC family transcriptional regulator [Chloroflexi bacterium]|nr:Lrp/AsnC family transcriptional regulator [Chloroflexota bacterium]
MAPERRDIDSTDMRLIGLLQENPRMSVVEAASRLGASQPTVRKRVRRLLEEDIIHFLCLVNPVKMGYLHDCVIHIQVEAGKAEDVAEKISQMDEVSYVAYTLGPYDLSVGASFTSSDEIHAFLSKKVAPIEGVVRTDTSYVLSLIKRSYGRQPRFNHPD